MESEIVRKQLLLEGLIQGVGFRPFVFHLASELGVKGWAANTVDGITLDLEAESKQVAVMINRLQQDKPQHSRIESLLEMDLPVVGHSEFEIRESVVDGNPSVYVPADIATCPVCLKECFNPDNRRYRYPFITCSHCGPRFSIVESLPFDRGRTAMKHFILCKACQAEYEDADDRRFHAQTIACWDCGPRLALWDASGSPVADQYAAIQSAIVAIKSGATVALKGIGGFQLLVDAGQREAVAHLRHAKARPDKPFAVMLKDIDAVSQVCELSALEQQWLCSPAAPIVLLKRNSSVASIAENVAPGNTHLGVMLPHSPLHHLLMAEMQRPLIATSGNRVEEPICVDEKSAMQRLQGVADYYLVHNRPVIRALDDSIVRELFHQKMILRCARGYSPLAIKAKKNRQRILALGGHHKNTLALSQGKHIVLSQHIGNLDTLESVSVYDKTIQDLCKLYQIQPKKVVRDKHPDYYSSQYAEAMDLQKFMVQHHYAHALACMAEHQLLPPALGIVWDGSGYGEDGSIWGGEFLLIEAQGFIHQASFHNFSLPGGSAAIKAPRRTALGLLFELYGDSVFTQTDWPLLSVFTEQELTVLRKMLTKRINTPRCSSVGRLFDGMAGLLGLCQAASFDGQAALFVEQSVISGACIEPYRFHLIETLNKPDIIDWKPLLAAVINDLNQQVDVGVISQKFHAALAEIIVTVAKKVGRECVVLSGGCFQNRYLTEQAISRLQAAGFLVFWPQSIPPNDGGLAVGQVLAAIQNTGL